MKKYIVYEGKNKFESDSRNAIKHAIEGGHDVIVTDKSGNILSRAAHGENGVYRQHVEAGEIYRG